MTITLCPCGSKENFDSCCQPIIEGRIAAPTAERLMRSRYTAFTLGNGEYLMKSWHADHRNLSEQKETEQWAKSVKWMKLQIDAVEAGQADDTEGYVTFQAFFSDKGKVFKIHEKSLFYKVDGEWYYHSGIHF